ncbi:MAG: hypothetical protein CSA04_04205 [Bacteroidetes bacterium]|nr:MAG: hypothetical protein CSA04_04205 [Bacteroidota bacterium]
MISISYRQIPDHQQDARCKAAAPRVVFGVRHRGDAAAANAAGGILMVDQGKTSNPWNKYDKKIWGKCTVPNHIKPPQADKEKR